MSNSALERTLNTVANFANKRATALSELPALNEPVVNIADFSSNDYLSFASDPRVRDNFLKKLQGEECILGSRGSRIQDGNTPLIVRLEQRLQKFFNAPSCLIYNSAYEANCGLFRALPQPGDVVVVDELAHASIHDGLRLSKVRESVIFLRHNSVKHLRQILSELVSTRPAIKGGRSSVFVITEGIYSMHGDFVPLKEISSAMKQILPPGVGQLYVDETHSVGVIGEQGEGLVHMLGMEDEVQLRVQGFGKAMGTSGGVLLCSPTVRHYLLHACRNQVFSTASSQSNIIAMDNTIDMLESPIGREQIRKVHQISVYARRSIVQMVQNVPPQILRLEMDGPHLCIEGFYSPMVPLVTPLAVSLAGYLTASGYTFREMTQPIVPKGHERIRWTFHAANTTEEVDKFLGTLARWVKKQILEMQSEVPQDAKAGMGVNAKL